MLICANIYKQNDDILCKVITAISQQLDMADTSLLETLESLKQNDVTIPENIWQIIDKLNVKAFVPEVKSGFDKPVEEACFATYLLDIESVLNNVILILKKLVGRGNRPLSKDRVVNLVLICGEHSQDSMWTTKVTLKHSEELVKLLCEFWHCGSVEEFMQELFPAALLAIRPKLLKDTWKRYPAAVYCYQWLLFHVKSPYMGTHLASVLPTALIILDDFVLENRICGIRYINHIVDNVTRTELGWYGHGEVIYKALESLIHHREPDMIEPLMSCLVTVLGKVEGGYIKDEQNFQWSRYDDIMQMMLQSMETEQRPAYIKSLPLLLEAMGTRMCRWDKRLLRVLARYLEVAGYLQHSEAVHALRAVKVFLQHCWPFVPSHAQVLLQMLLRLLCDITYKEQSAEDEMLVGLVEECLVMVVNIAPKETQVLCMDIKTRARFNPTFTSVVDRVFQ